MPDTLYVAFDIFHAASYAPRRDANRPADYARNDESYTHDQERYYAVLQPFLIQTPLLGDYLATWNRARLSQPGAVTFLDMDTIAALPADSEVTPVPFPPDATLEIGATWSNGGAFRNVRDLGGAATPFGFPTAVWPEFAARNFMPVPIRNFAHLSQPQVEQLFTWAYGLMLTLEQRKDSLSAAEKAIYDAFFLEKPVGVPAGDLTGWRKLLVDGGKLGRLMDRLWHARDIKDEATLNPPGFRYTSEQLLNGGFGPAVFEVPPQGTYHRSLWDQLGRIADTKQAASALRRFYGFGERLRFPRAADKDRETDFMILQTAAEGAPGWFVTNSHSLLGQVFRIGPIPNTLAALAFKLQKLTVCGHDLASKTAARAAIEQQFDRTFLEAKSGAATGKVFGASLRQDPRGDRVWYVPRHARPQPAHVDHPDTKKPLYTVPGSLLDALDPTARNSMPAGEPGGDLAKQTIQRTLIAPSEILGAGSYAQWNHSLRFVRIKVRLEAVSLAGAPPGAVAYRLTLARTPHEQDSAVVLAGMRDFEANSAALWVARSEDGVEKLTSFSLANNVRLLEPAKLLVLDRNGSLTKLLPERGAVEGAGLAQQTADVDLAFLVGTGPTLGPNEMFNLVTKEDPATNVPLLILAGEFEHRVSRSADRIAERFGLLLDPPPPFPSPGQGDADPDHPVLGHFANFNKLRVDLVAGATVVRVNHPDATLPLPAAFPLEPHKQALANAHYSYWVTHQLSEEVRQTLLETEDARYLAYGSAGTRWLLAGQVEHQYSHKVPIDGSGALRLPLSSDIRNLSGVCATRTGENTPLFALTFDVTPAPEAVRLTLDPKYLELAAAGARETPASLRPLYEAFYDLRAAAQSTGADAAVLRLERWNFDNSKNPPRPNQIADRDSSLEFPSIEKNMRFGGAAERRLTPSDVSSFTDLLGPSFAAFQANVTRQRQPLAIQLPLDDAWRWSDADPAKVLPLASTTNSVRLGLRLGRTADRAIGGEYLREDEQFIPLRLEADAQRESPELRTADLVSLRPKARDRLREYIESDSSPLRRSFSWILSKDESRDAQPRAGSDRDRELKLLGEAYRFLNFPDGLAGGVDRVVRLFHVPFAFAPVAKHPAFGDPQTTLDFAEFVLNLLASLARGIKPEEVDLKVETDLVAAFERRAQVEALIGGPNGLAQRLLSLVQRIDSEETQDALFAHVERCLSDLGATRQDAMRALLAADVGLFSGAKAVAVGVFDPETWSDKLFALQVRKRIREGSVASPIAGDTDRFSFARFFGEGKRRFLIDVLDDRSYDDDYHIAENEYRTEKPRIEPRLRGEVVGRGDTAARTAEDVLEEQNLLDQGGTNRSVLADFVHYNPEWVTRRDGKIERRYLLPSRRFPRAPKPVLPNTPRVTRLIADLPPGQDLAVQFARRVAAVMDPNAQLVGSSGPISVMSNKDRRAVVAAEDADGWYRLDSYLSHYYFVVESDEERTFDNDVFAITVERGAEPFTPEPPIPATTFKPVTDLQKWFVYNRRREEVTSGEGGSAETVERPSVPLTLDRIIAESRQWLATRNPVEPFNDQLLLEPQKPVDAPPSTATFSFTADKWQLQNTDPSDGVPASRLGNVVAAELMSFASESGDQAERAVLHLAVLDDAWSYQRVRVQTLRNGLDINGNRKVDINPVFRMLSRASEWVDYGRDVVSLHAIEDRFPPAVAALRSLRTLDSWLTAEAEFDLGDVVRQVSEATFKSGGSNLPFWNQAQILSDNKTVSGVVLQVIPDSHPRQGRSGPALSGVSPRGDILTKQILGPISAANSWELTRRLLKQEILAARPHIRVTWWNEKRVPLLEVTWPIEWR